MTPKGKAVAAIGGGALTAALGVVAYFEGNRPDPYLDPIGIPTVCYGHTGDVEKRRYSSAECQALLGADLLAADAGLQRCVAREMPDNVRAAFVSFAFNVGVARACGSGAVRRWNGGDAAGACAELVRWVYAGDPPKVLPGLVKRRAAERALCEGRPVSLGAVG